MSTLKNWLVSALVALTVAGCGGGGGDAGESVFGGGTTTPDAAVTPASLILTVDESSVVNSTSTPVGVKVIAVNSSNQTLADVPVVLSVDGAQISGSGATGTDGSLTGSVDHSSSKANRVITVTATSGSVSASKTIVVSGVKITATPTPAIVQLGSSGNKIEFTVADANSTGIAGMSYSISTPFESSPVVGTTDGNGRLTYTYSVPADYASSEFTATITAGGVTQSQTIPVQQGSVSIPAATASVATPKVEIDPAVVGVNTAGSTTQTATIRFKAFDSNSLPIKNVRVSFDLDGDPNEIGGEFTSGDNLVYTDSNGIATTTYIPGDKATAPQGLKIRACYSGSDFTPSSTGDAASGSAQCPASATQTMTIDNEALNITIGSDDTITETTDGLRYVVKYVVQVVNASGQAKQGVTITPTLDLLGFEKGGFVYDELDSRWEQVVTSVSTYQDRDVSSIVYSGCVNEDTNRNAIVDAGEDKDLDGKLEPRKSDAAVSFIVSGQSTTDETGAVGLQVTYLKNVATWLRVKIYVSGSVAGTEGVGTFETILPAPTEVLKKESTPAFATNPYGAQASCSAH